MVRLERVCMIEQVAIELNGGKPKKSSKQIMESCQRVYGTCTDGSYEACLAHDGYYQSLNEEKANEVINDNKNN